MTSTMSINEAAFHNFLLEKGFGFLNNLEEINMVKDGFYFVHEVPLGDWARCPDSIHPFRKIVETQMLMTSVKNSDIDAVFDMDIDASDLRSDFFLVFIRKNKIKKSVAIETQSTIHYTSLKHFGGNKGLVARCLSDVIKESCGSEFIIYERGSEYFSKEMERITTSFMKS